tara:strand:+ start:55896 stop:56111 length:216 start_codon:yes stop_codon:yes gene_type:complete
MFDQEEYKTFKTSTLAQLSYVLDGENFYITTHREGDNGELLTGWFFGPKALKETAEFLLGLAAQLETKKED